MRSMAAVALFVVEHWASQSEGIDRLLKPKVLFQFGNYSRAMRRE